MVEILWIIAPLVLLGACLSFVLVYLPSFWPNRADKLAQNQMLLPALLLVYSASVAWFRIVTSLAPPPPPHPELEYLPVFQSLFTVEHMARVVIDLGCGAVVLWRTIQVFQIQHEND